MSYTFRLVKETSRLGGRADRWSTLRSAEVRTLAAQYPLVPAAELLTNTDRYALEITGGEASRTTSVGVTVTVASTGKRHDLGTVMISTRKGKTSLSNAATGLSWAGQIEHAYRGLLEHVAAQAEAKAVAA